MSEPDLKKRKFLKGSAIAALAAGFVGTYSPVLKNIYKRSGTPNFPDATELDDNVTLMRSVCLQCHSACGFQARIIDFDSDNPVAVKLNGNPYHPATLIPHLDYSTSLDDAKHIQGHICAKGEAGLETLYDENRLKYPLKRVGPRGSGKWQRITWDQFYKEIIEGAELPTADGKGTYTFEGLLDLLSDDPIDPNRTWLGPKRNQILFSVGRSEHGRKELSDRIFGYVFGTKNSRIDHTTICEQSHHISFKYSCAGKTHLKPDFHNAKMIITFGGNYLAADFPFNANGDRLMRFKENGGKLVVVDPRFSQTAKHADVWLPIKPGTDAALASAIARIIIEEELYDEAFLKAPNSTVASSINESVWTDATHLVNMKTHKYVTVDDVGVTGTSGNHVVWDGSNYVDAETATTAELYLRADPTSNVLTLPNGDPVKTAFEAYRDEVFSKTVDEWLEICGLTAFKDTVTEIARDFALAGKKAIADFYRGPVQHTNGYYNGLSIIYLNFLVGNFDWKGGLSVGGSHWHEMGTSVNGTDTTYNGLKTLGTSTSASGWKVTREGQDWAPGNEEYDYWAGKGVTEPPRPFFPLTSNVWQEMWGAIETGYPYEIKMFWNHMGAPTYSTPSSKKVEEVVTLADENGKYKLPLLISVDVVMGDTTALADYVLPEVTFYEQFATPHIAPSIQIKVSAIRQPIFGVYDPETGNYTYRHVPGYEETKMAEDIYIELALKLKEEYNVNLDGVGDGAFFGGSTDPYGFPDQLRNAWDWYRRAIINLIEDYELHGGTIPGDNIKQKIKYVLDRGGIFEEFKEYEDSGKKLPHKLGKQVTFWSEKVATKHHSYKNTEFTKDYAGNQHSENLYWGTARYIPVQDMKGNKVQEDDYKDGFTFHLVTYKMPIHTQSRTHNNRTLVELLPENGVEINIEDAKRLGIKDGDMVKITSATNTEGVIGKAIVTRLVRPGVIAVNHTFGLKWSGSKDWIEIDEKGNEITIKGQSWKTSGITANPVMRLDTSYVTDQNKLTGAISLTDPVGGSASFYDTLVKIEKV